MKTALESKRVLIVEDEVLIAEELRERLERLDFRIVGIAATGADAIRLAEEKRPNLVLMDIRLKGVMDGIAAAEHLLQHFDLPVVFLTAHSDSATLERAKATAPFGYLLKPFQERDLCVTIEMAMQRHKVESRLRESEARYRATLSSIGDGVITTDVAGHVTFMNRAAEGMTGWAMSEAGGLPIEGVLVLASEPGGPPTMHPVSEALRDKLVVRVSEGSSLIHRDGERIPFDDSVAPIIDTHEHLWGAVMAFRDGRERKRNAEALRRTEEMLRRAQKMEAVGRLAGGLAHDFNNLITIILCNAELLLENGMLEDSLVPFARGVHGAGERAADLTRQLLAYSSRQVLNALVMDLNVVIADTRALLHRLIGEDVELVVRSSPNQALARVDRGQIEQVIMNLATNARDAMPHGGRLTIELGKLVVDPLGAAPFDIEAGRYVRIAVNDTGMGMDADTRSKAFDPFFTTKGPGKGTGLGLATVLGIIRQMGGGVQLRSEVGLGSTFTILLPEVGATEVSLKEVEAHKPVRGGSETILLVEDEEGVRSISAIALESYGYTVIRARDAAEAILAFDTHRGSIRMLITDLVMPGMNGRQLADCLHSRVPTLPVLYVSGYAADTLIRHELSAADLHFLQKPFTPITLARRVREIQDVRGVAPELI